MRMHTKNTSDQHNGSGPPGWAHRSGLAWHGDWDGLGTATGKCDRELEGTVTGSGRQGRWVPGSFLARFVPGLLRSWPASFLPASFLSRFVPDPLRSCPASFLSRFVPVPLRSGPLRSGPGQAPGSSTQRTCVTVVDDVLLEARVDVGARGVAGDAARVLCT